jgi:hypothetical protein
VKTATMFVMLAVLVLASAGIVNAISIGGGCSSSINAGYLTYTSASGAVHHASGVASVSGDCATGYVTVYWLAGGYTTYYWP